MTELRRRDFLRMLGGSALAGLLPLSLPRRAEAVSFNDYRAVVCVFLLGGNDALNMVLPTAAAGGAGYDNYAAIRGSLAVANTDLSGALNTSGNLLDSGSGNPYYRGGSLADSYRHGLYPVAGAGIGINGMMPELFRLIDDGDAAVIANVGTLVEPVTRATLGSAALPVYLFAHNHQQRELQTGQADGLNLSGWAGRLFDHWQGVNGGHAFGMNVSYDGSRRLLIGEQTAPLVLKPGQPTAFNRMSRSGNSSEMARRNMHLDLHAQPAANPFRRLYGEMLLRAFSLTDLLAAAWDGAPDFSAVSGPYGEALFAVPDPATLGLGQRIGGRLIAQMEAVVKLMAYSRDQGIRRQFFFVGLHGFDTHGNHASKHPLLLRELSLALWKLQRALDHLGLRDQVVTYTLSDFGRTVSNNGDGTDHAWGSHQLVMGGPVIGGALHGTLPDLTLGGADDYSTRGRLIPTLSADAYQATVARWFGVDDALMDTLFPNLGNFATRYLGFLPAA